MLWSSIHYGHGQKIKCYEKLNFKEHVIIDTQDTLGVPVTLKLMIKLL